MTNEKRSYKKMGQPFIRLRAILSRVQSHSIPTPTYGGLLFADLHFPFDADCSQWPTPYFHIHPQILLSLQKEVLPTSLYRIVAQMISSEVPLNADRLTEFLDYFCFVDLLSERTYLKSL